MIDSLNHLFDMPLELCHKSNFSRFRIFWFHSFGNWFHLAFLSNWALYYCFEFLYALVLEIFCILENYCVTFKLYRIDFYRHMYNPWFRICFRCVPILVSFLWILNSSNLLIWIELYVISWIPYVPLLSIPFKSEYTCERLLLTSDWLVKAHVRFVVPRVLPIYATYC